MGWVAAAAAAGTIVGSLLADSSARSANNQQAANSQRALDSIQTIMADAQAQELKFLDEGNEAAAAAIRAAAVAELEGFAAIMAAIPGMKEEMQGIAEAYKQEAIEFYQPFIADKFGVDQARNYQNAMLGLPNLDGTPNTFDADIITSRPSFKFREEQGFKAADRSAAARTGSLGGRAVREAQQFASDMASQEFEKEFTRAGNLGNALQTSAQFGATGAARETGTAAGRVIQSFTGLNSKLLSALGGIGDANAREQRDLGSLALDNAGNRIQLNQNRSNALVNAVGGGVDTENRRIASNALSRQNLIGDLSQAGSSYLTNRFGGGGGDSVLTPPKRNTPAQNQAARDAGINIQDYYTKKKVSGTGKTRIGDGSKGRVTYDTSGNVFGLYK